MAFPPTTESALGRPYGEVSSAEEVCNDVINDRKLEDIAACNTEIGVVLMIAVSGADARVAGGGKNEDVIAYPAASGRITTPPASRGFRYIQNGRLLLRY
ncbi:MAG: hypothetical protein JWL86_1016 [Rhizobium sp.]|nr:hypothetical protein [Rhizobium sp.]